MGKLKVWFKSLPKPVQGALEQAGHFGLMLLFSLVLADRLFEWWRELVHQWPPGWPKKFGLVEVSTGGQLRAIQPGWWTQLDRVADTKRDMLFGRIGGTVGDAIRTGILIWLVVR